jgi:hypothetical protein
MCLPPIFRPISERRSNRIKRRVLSACLWRKNTMNFILTVHYTQIYEILLPFLRWTFGTNWFTYTQTIRGPQLSDELFKHTRLYTTSEPNPWFAKDMKGSNLQLYSTVSVFTWRQWGHCQPQIARPRSKTRNNFIQSTKEKIQWLHFDVGTSL